MQKATPSAGLVHAQPALLSHCLCWPWASTQLGRAAARVPCAPPRSLRSDGELTAPAARLSLPSPLTSFLSSALTSAVQPGRPALLSALWLLMLPWVGVFACLGPLCVYLPVTGQDLPMLVYSAPQSFCGAGCGLCFTSLLEESVESLGSPL